MHMRRTLSFTLLLAAAFIALSPPTAHADFKKVKIAVLDFQMQGEEGETKDMGKIVAEWMITGLVETGRFDVIERRLLEKLLEEQKLGATGAIDPTSAAQLGKILGVSTIVSGTVTNLEGYTEINARLINVDTASIVAAEKVRAGTAEKLRDLVAQVTTKIALAFPMEGYVVQRTDRKVTIDLGRLIGVKPGMKFVAYKEGKVIKHPKTGAVLDVETIEIGIIEIRDVRDKTAVGVLLQEVKPNSVVYGTMVRSSAKDGLSEEAVETPAPEEGSGSEDGLLRRLFRRTKPQE